MSRTKLDKFAELSTFGNVIQGQVNFGGCWRHEFFRNDNPITLELGCGRGDYTIALAQKYPKRNFIGIDLKGARIWSGAKKASELNLANVAFLRCSIKYLNEFFGLGEIDEIWLPFPDPFSRHNQAKRRLTSPAYLSIYKSILKPNGLGHFKTDDEGLFKYTLATLKSENCPIYEVNEDLHYDGACSSNGDINQELPTRTIISLDSNDLVAIKTKYELVHLAEGKIIKYVRFGLGGKSKSNF